MNKKYKLGVENRDTIKKVAQQIGGIVGKTLGPGGRNYLLNSGITNDGKTILKSIRFEDENEDLLSLIFQDVAENADKDGGDGTTTATVIATKLVNDIIDKVPDLNIPISQGQMSVMDIKDTLEKEKDRVLSLMKDKVKDVGSLEELENVAFTSMENKEIAKKVAKAVWDVGSDGFVSLEDGFSGEVEVEHVPGIKYKIGVVAPFQYTNHKNEAIYSGSPILIANHYFNSLSEINNLLAQFNESKKFSSFVIVAKGFEPPFIRSVYDLSQKAGFNILLLKTSISDEEFEDIASFVDAQVINTSPRIGQKIENVKFQDLGFNKKIIAGEKETVFIGGQGLEKQIMTDDGPLTRVTSRVNALKDLLGDKNDKELEGRISRLSGGIAIIRVDAKTQTEKYYLKLKIEDTRNSCKGALKHGIIQGGGLVFDEIAEQLGSEALLYGALKEPYKVIKNNYGGKLEIGPEIVDSFNVARSSLENAVSVVKILITMEGNIADKEISLVEEFKNKIIYN